MIYDQDDLIDSAPDCTHSAGRRQTCDIRIGVLTQRQKTNSQKTIFIYLIMVFGDYFIYVVKFMQLHALNDGLSFT